MPKAGFYWGPRLPKRNKNKVENDLPEAPAKEPEVEFTVTLNYVHSDIFDEGERYFLRWDACHRRLMGETEPQAVEHCKLYFNLTVQVQTDMSMKVAYLRHMAHKFERLSRSVDVKENRARDDKHYQWINFKIFKVTPRGFAKLVDELHLNLMDCTDFQEPTEKKVLGDDSWGKVTIQYRQLDAEGVHVITSDHGEESAPEAPGSDDDEGAEHYNANDPEVAGSPRDADGASGSPRELSPRPRAEAAASARESSPRAPTTAESPYRPTPRDGPQSPGRRSPPAEETP
jgi:hypothetical protein